CALPILRGVAEIGDIIEAFGGTGGENANEYLGTVQANENGNWSLTATTSYDYLIVTATDQNNNTSEFSDAILVSPTCAKPTNLSSTEGISTSHTLTWDGTTGVTYNVAVGVKGLSPIDENWVVGYNTNIADNQITISGLDENTVYEFYVSTNCVDEVSHWAGPVEFNPTIPVQSGETCEQAITITADTNLFYSDYTMIGDEMWFKFTALADTCGVFVVGNNLSPYHLSEISLLNGNCSNYELLESSEYNDSLNIWMTNLIEGHEYFVKVNDQNEESFDFTIGLYFRKNNIKYSCPVVCPNLLRNGDFESLSTVYHPICPFNSSQQDVCGWNTAFGSPQIKIADPNNADAPHHVYMWVSGGPYAVYGEGIYQNIKLCEGEEYRITYKYRATSGSSNPVNYQIRIYATQDGAFNVTENPEDGDEVPVFNNNNYQTISNNTVGTDNWKLNVHEFTANSDYTRLLIYPYKDSSPYINFRMDSIVLERIHTYSGEDQSICEGESTQLEPTDCHPHYTWSSTPAGFNSNQSNPIVSPTVNTTYYLTITDDNGCTATDNIFVHVDHQPDATINPVNPMCVDEFPIYLSAVSMGIGSYWSGTGIVDHISGQFDPSAAGVGIHTIFYSIVNGTCSDSATTTIEVLSPPIITATNDGPVCVGQDVHFSSASESTIVEYQWFGPGGTLDTIPGFTIPNAQLNHAGDYMVTVTDENGCTNEAITTLELFDPQVNIIADDTVICNSESISLDAGTGWFSYQWSTGENTQVIEVDEPDTYYSVTITDIHGCEGIDTIYIEGSNMFIFNTIIAYTCEGANIGSISHTINGGDYPMIFEWTGPNGFTANTEDISNLYAGQYFFTVTDVNGCQAFAQYIINDFENPDLAITSDTICYEENSGTLEVSVTNMTGSFIYEWSNGENTAIISNLIGGNYTVTVTNSDNGCFSTISSVILNYPIPEVTINAEDTIICNMVPITLDAGEGWSSYHWSTDENTQVIEVDEPDTYYSVTVTDIHGCEGIDTIHIEGSNMAIKDSLVVHTCEGENDGSITQTIIGGDEPLSFEWAGPDGFTANTEDISELFAGQYFFTVTDANGCFLEGFYIVDSFPIPLLEISTENACNNDNTGSAEVIVTNIPGPFSYIWSNGETDDEINNQYPGQYFVTVTDNTTGCSAEAVANIESYSVDAHFDWAPECLNLTSIQNNGMYYYPTSVDWDDYEDYEYYWELGNGTIGADFLMILDYEYEGFYCASLTMTQGNCANTYEEQVYVYPSNCYCTAVEDDYDPNVYYAWYWEIDAGTTEQWDNRQVWINDRLVIEDGATLTLKQCTIHMGPKGRIIVEPKATLNSVASVFTSWELGPECDHMWQGIEVHGQGPYSPNPHIGSVNFYGSPEEPSIVKNAHIAVLLGERNMDYTCMVESFTGALPFYIKGYDGKMVVGNQNVTFENNGIDVKMVQTMFYPYNNDSKITNCQFICNAPLLDPAYHINHPDPYGFGFSPYGYPNQINPRNPWAGPANPYQRTVAGIWSHKQNFKVVKNCDFKNMQTGIESYQSRYDVAVCDFTFMITGINIMNYDAYASSSHRITRNTFDNIPGVGSETGNHINITNGMYDKIQENTFGSGNPMSINGTGINTTGASKFLISENDFLRLPNGVKISNSGLGGGDVRADIAASHDDWRGNIFENCNTNMLADAYNPKLRLRCNMCYNNTSSVTPINIDNTGFLANQGYTPPPMSVTVPNQTKYGAGNEFLGSVPNPKRVDSDNTYYYYHHESPFQTIPNPNDVYTVLGSVHYPKFTNAQSCPLLVPDIWFLPPGFDSQVFITLDSLYNAVEVIKTELAEMKESLDNGQTQELLNAIYSNMANGRLKNLLIENSPLSDTVLTALFIEYPLSHGNFKNVMLLNLPVSSSVEPFFFERISTIPSGTANILLPLQSYNPGVVTPAFLNRKLDETILEKQLYLNNLVSILTDTVNNREQDAINLLQSDNSADSYVVIAGDYTMSGNYADAQIIINQLDSQYPELSDWVAYKELLLSLYQSGKTIFDMNLEEYNFVKDLAFQCPHGPATAAAQSVLYLISRETVPECELMNTRSKPQLVKPVDFIIPDTDAYITENYPDPFTSVTYVDYFIPEGSIGIIVLNDMYGRKIKEYEVFEGENVLTISKDNLIPGVYTYGLIVDNKLVEFKKLVITQ
ncbi:MAG: hypothetical protein PHW83_05925, partial [Bacteroidales bacterium]|nr:hypothetical protein [Bacteroidales bacterium]